MNRVLLLSIALVLALAAAVLPRRSDEDLAARRAAELLDLSTASAALPLWRALLASPALERTDAGPVLHLGATAADPTIALLSARTARELLELPCTSEGETRPLWRAILASPAAERTESGTTLRLYGVRLQADAAFFPDIDHHLEARLSLARGLEGLAARDPACAPFTLTGELDPVHGGANLLVVQQGTTQALEFSVDGAQKTQLRVERSFLPEAPNDELLRAALVHGLLERAHGDPAFASLRIEGEESPVPGGATFRFGRVGDTEMLSFQPVGSAPTRVSRPWAEPRAGARFATPGRIGLAGSAFLVLLLAFARGGPRKP